VIKTVKWTYTGLIFLFLYAPIAVLIVYSFNDSRFRTWNGFTLRWYRELFGNAAIMQSLRNTLIIAFVSATVATVVGTVAAIGINAMKRGPKAVIMNVAYLPVINPDIVTGISLLLLFVFLNIPPGFATLLLAHITFNIPYVILSVMPRIKMLSKHTYEAAMDLGAPPYLAFRKAVLPEIMPGIVNGFLLALTLSIDDFVISFFTTGPGVSTLSITIFSMARRGIRPEINALSSLMFVTVLTLLIIINIRATPPDIKRKRKG